MKKKVIVLSFVCYLLCLVGCGEKIKFVLPDNAIEYTVRNNEELDCLELLYDGKIYRPYCAAEVSHVDCIIGYYEEIHSENDKYMHYVFNLKGESSDEWLVEACDEGADYLNSCNIGFVWKEVNVTNIPKGIEKETEYEWNN